MNPRPIITLAAIATLVPTLAMAPEIKRELSADRETIDALETKPFDQAALASLTNWTHPGTLSDSNTQGKVVIIAMISAGEPSSYMTLSKLTRMQRDNEDEVVIAAIHPDTGWDQIKEKIDAGRITVPIARDEGAVFASAMHTDDYPDIYVIDRAGNLRFADLEGRSLKDAVKLLTSETPESAVANAALQAQGIAPEAAATASSISPDAYDKAPWPDHNGRQFHADNYQGQKLPVPMGNEDWVDNERSLEGKVLVLDFWATWCGPCIRAAPMLRDLQESYDGKLEIVGIGGSEKEETFRRYVLKKKGNYAQMFDKDKTLNNALGITGIPHVVVLSTDGVIRWQGNPLNDEFKQVVAMTIAADPLLAANSD
ncbi:MAG: TlpA family protein disulfide reductase [Phycisphaerales bacterium]|nr:TlpA family protein disulfide reductase [Phycisphaerales bacterium]